MTAKAKDEDPVDTPTAPDEVTVRHPETGDTFKVPRPTTRGNKEGQEFNVTVRHPKTRHTHAQRFVVRKGKAEPVNG